MLHGGGLWCQLLLHGGVKAGLTLLLGLGRVLCSGCDPSNELNRLRCLHLSLLREEFGSYFCARALEIKTLPSVLFWLHQKEIRSCFVLFSHSISGEVMVLLVFESIRGALTYDFKHSFGGCDANVLGICRPGAGKILPYKATSLTDIHVHGASCSAGWCQDPSWWLLLWDGCAWWGPGQSVFFVQDIRRQT